MGEQDYMLTINLERDTAKRIGATSEVADFIEMPANEPQLRIDAATSA